MKLTSSRTSISSLLSPPSFPLSWHWEIKSIFIFWWSQPSSKFFTECFLSLLVSIGKTSSPPSSKAISFNLKKQRRDRTLSGPGAAGFEVCAVAGYWGELELGCGRAKVLGIVGAWGGTTNQSNRTQLFLAKITQISKWNLTNFLYVIFNVNVVERITV